MRKGDICHIIIHICHIIIHICVFSGVHSRKARRCSNMRKRDLCHIIIHICHIIIHIEGKPEGAKTCAKET